MTAARSLRALSRCLALVVMTSAARARADTPPPAVRHEEPDDAPRTEGDEILRHYTDTPYLALRLLPVDLVSSVFHAGVEIKILSDLTLVSQVGLGRVKHRYFDDKLNELSSERRTYLSLDLQARYYAVGQIGTGIYLSADTSYTWLNSDQFVKSPLMDLSSGMRVGGSFGGAYTSFFGLGVDMQFLIHGRVYTPSFAETSPSELRPGPLAFGASIALTYVF